MFWKIIDGVCDFIFTLFFFKANSFFSPTKLHSRRAEGHASVCLYFSCTLCRSWVFPICERSHCAQYAASRSGTDCLSGTAINHNTEKQKFICIQLPSTFEAADLELNFFSLRLLPSSALPSSFNSLPPAPSSSLERRYDLRGSQKSTLCFPHFFFLFFFPRGRPDSTWICSGSVSISIAARLPLAFSLSKAGKRERRKNLFSSEILQNVCGHCRRLCHHKLW